jgi:hypothetical protein
MEQKDVTIEQEETENIGPEQEEGDLHLTSISELRRAGKEGGDNGTA